MPRPALPAEYVTGRERGASIVALPFALEGVARLVREHGSLYEAAAVAPDAPSLRGRGAAYRLRIEETEVVVRHYRRGGAVAAVLGDRYARIGRPRPLRELQASVAARARGVDTPEVVCTVTYPAAPFYRGDIATRYVPASRDHAAAVLAAGRLDDAGRAAAWRAAGALLRAAFAAGVEHADLNLRNILIADGGARAWLIDLDRAVIHGTGVSAEVRARMLARLHRSRRKLEAQLGNAATPAELAAFEAGLAG